MIFDIRISFWVEEDPGVCYNGGKKNTGNVSSDDIPVLLQGGFFMSFWRTVLTGAAGYFAVWLLNRLLPWPVFRSGMIPALAVYVLISVLMIYLPFRKKGGSTSSKRVEYIVNGQGALTSTVFQPAQYRDYRQIDANKDGRTLIGPVGQIVCTGYGKTATPVEGKNPLHLIYLCTAAALFALVAEWMIPSGCGIGEDDIYVLALYASCVSIVLSLGAHLGAGLFGMGIAARRELRAFALEAGWFSLLFYLAQKAISPRGYREYIPFTFEDVVLFWGILWIVLMIGGAIVKKSRKDEERKILSGLRWSAFLLSLAYSVVTTGL